jgi:hypothetical protein
VLEREDVILLGRRAHLQRAQLALEDVGARASPELLELHGERLLLVEDGHALAVPAVLHVRLDHLVAQPLRDARVLRGYGDVQDRGRAPPRDRDLGAVPVVLGAVAAGVPSPPQLVRPLADATAAYDLRLRREEQIGAIAGRFGDPIGPRGQFGRRRMRVVV